MNYEMMVVQAEVLPMRRLHILFLAAAVCGYGDQTAWGQEVVADSLVVTEDAQVVRRFWLEPIVVTASRMDLSGAMLFQGKEDARTLFDGYGFAPVTRGSALTVDLYADGLKRADLPVLLDGERFPTACPNRMDNPCTRINPLEIAAVDLSKTCCDAGAGLGGQVEFHRARPAQEPRLRMTVSGSGGAADGVDVALAADAAGYRLSARLLRTEPYEDGAGLDFTERYDYARAPRQELSEISLFGGQGELSHGVTYSSTSDVAFPYLRMDERENEFWSAFAAWRGNKLYLNHTDHTMDNALRTGAAMMVMETVTSNWSAGLSGDGYELFYRRWDADNELANADGSMQIDNHMIPEIHRYSARLFRSLSLTPSVSLQARAGYQWDHAGDEARLAFMRPLYPEADADRGFLVWGAGANWVHPLDSVWSLGLLAEAVTEPPQPQELFIGVQKMGDKPWWSGNPALDAPLRATARMQLRSRNVRLEAYCSRVEGYVVPRRRDTADHAYLTYGNADAVLAGANLDLQWRYLQASASVGYGENLQGGNHPLAEIRPASVRVKGLTPARAGVRSFLRWSAAAEQNRVDVALSEAPTPAWQRLDLGILGSWSRLDLQLEVENLLDADYYQHLSYVRDPFASGARVHDPGRVLRVRLAYGI
jgi:iron complex outermembrane receptor protein